MAFLGKDFIFIICFLKVQLYLCIYLICVFICQSPVNLLFLSHYFSALNLFQGFSCAVDKLLNLSRVNSHGQFIFGKQSLSLFRGNTAFQQNRCNFPHSLDMLKTGLFFTFFVKMNC